MEPVRRRQGHDLQSYHKAANQRRLSAAAENHGCTMKFEINRRVREHAAKTLLVSIFFVAFQLLAQSSIPEWCRALPRPEYKALERVPISDPWYEVYKPAAGVFAIYEPHQSEETISYLILGDKRAMLFDTGMGISDLKNVIAELTKLPMVVLNSHTHDDHVGDNWEFDKVYGMDTDFTRQNARGSREDAQAEATPAQTCAV